MWKTILQILSCAGWIVKWFIGKRSDPQNQYQRARNENAEIIKTGDQDAANRKLDELTDRLPNSGNGDSR